MKLSCVIPSNRGIHRSIQGFIYLIVNTVNNKKYVGLTTGTIAKRWKEHIFCAKMNLDYPIYRAIKKYGVEAFEVREISASNSLDELNNLEQFFIKSYDTVRPNGYNLTTGGKVFLHHPETKAKIGRKHKGKIVSEETKAKLRLAMVGKPPIFPKGTKFTEEHRRNISKARGHKGIPHTAEWKLAMSLRQKGNTWCKGRKLSEDHIRKLKEHAKTRKKNDKGVFISQSSL